MADKICELKILLNKIKNNLDDMDVLLEQNSNHLQELSNDIDKYNINMKKINKELSNLNKECNNQCKLN